MKNCFEIGTVKFSVFSDFNFPWTDEVKVFETVSGYEKKEELTYKIDFAKEFIPVWGTVLHRDSSMIVMNADEKECRIHLLPKSGEPFAMTKHVDQNNVHILIDVRALSALKWDRNLVGLFSLEHFCLQYQSFLLHASYIIHEGQAIIFTAPSGTGKSTQADLWAKYEHAKIINGDRTLLVNKDGTWYASGFPVCGSSEYCLNEMAPVHAIVCLAQSKDNVITKLSPVHSLKNIYSQAFVNKWNVNDCDLIVSYIFDLAQKVSVLKYSCTKEKNAVLDLKHFLQ